MYNHLEWHWVFPEPGHKIDRRGRYMTYKRHEHDFCRHAEQQTNQIRRRYSTWAESIRYITCRSGKYGFLVDNSPWWIHLGEGPRPERFGRLRLTDSSIR